MIDFFIVILYLENIFNSLIDPNNIRGFFGVIYVISFLSDKFVFSFLILMLLVS